MLLPIPKPSSLYSLLKLVYVTSQLRYSLVGRTPPKKNPGSAPGNHGEREHFTHAPLIG